MKNSETEREITELIKTTLDNYHEDYIPGAWENFVSVRKRQKKIIFLRVGSAIAACFIIGLIGVSYFKYNPDIEPFKTAVSNDQILSRGKIDPANRSESLSPAKENSGENYASNGIQRQNSPDSGSKSLIVSAIPKRSVNQVNTFNSKESDQIRANPQEGKNPNAIGVPADSFKTIQKASADRPDSVFAKAGSKKSGSSESKFSKDTDLLSRFAANNIANPEKKKIRIGINFSPGVNSSSGGSAFNYSGGVSTDIALFSNFLLSTGLQIEHQSVVNENNNAAASRPFARTRADLVNLDLPLNLTWKFFSDKSKSFYVSGGISSLAYLSEKYDKTTSVLQLTEIKTSEAYADRVAYKLENHESKIETKESSLSAIDIAGRVNVIFGVEQRLSPKLYLHLEPYMKIPVSGLASENLRFSTGGITCKISF